MFSQKVYAIHRLRVNIKSLAAESIIIRKECKRCSLEYLNEMVLHRRGRLREEARLSHLALGFIRGRPYKEIESKAKVPIDAEKLTSKINKFYKTSVPEVRKWLS